MKRKRRKKKKKKSKSKSRRRRRSKHDSSTSDDSDSSEQSDDSFLDEISVAIDKTKADKKKEIERQRNEMDELQLKDLRNYGNDDDDDGEEDLFNPSNQELLVIMIIYI